MISDQCYFTINLYRLFLFAGLYLLLFFNVLFGFLFLELNFFEPGLFLKVFLEFLPYPPG